MLTEAQKRSLAFLVETLRKHAVEFQISGGLAAIAYGAQRPLYDIDLEIYKKDVEKARELFKDYITMDWSSVCEGPEDQFDIWMMTLVIEGVPVDINQIEGSKVRAVGGEWIPQPEVIETQPMIIDGIEVPVQKKEDLIAYKKILARDTDLVDIEQIS